MLLTVAKNIYDLQIILTTFEFWFDNPSLKHVETFEKWDEKSYKQCRVVRMMRILKWLGGLNSP